MEPIRDDRLIAELQALRPAPRPAFAAELDARAAAGFPRRPRAEAAPPLKELIERLRTTPRRRLFAPAGALAVAAIVSATAIVTAGGGGAGGGTSSELGFLSGGSAPQTSKPLPHLNGSVHHGAQIGKGTPASNGKYAAGGAGTAVEAEVGTAASSAEPVPPPELQPFSKNPGSHHRDVERSASIVLGADPEDVADDASQVFEAVHAHNGIVMRSSTSQGKAGEAGSRFELLIPSRELGEAMAAFSQIDNVRSRREATADITAPTVTAGELLKESRARIDSLLAELEAAESEAEREVVEAELRHERRHAGRLAAQLTHLHRRADFSRVSLQIVSGASESSTGGAWGFDDALRDAGQILAVAAAVTLVALAVLGPIALIALLAWLTHRAWVRRQRRRVLS